MVVDFRQEAKRGERGRYRERVVVGRWCGGNLTMGREGGVSDWWGDDYCSGMAERNREGAESLRNGGRKGLVVVGGWRLVR